MELAEKMQPHDQRLVTALDHVGNEYLGQNPAAAEAAYERELKVSEEIFGVHSANTAMPLQSLGRNALMQKDYAAAEKFYFREVDVNEKVYGEGSDRVAASLLDAASVYVVQKDYAKAEPYILRAVHIDESLYGGDSVGMLIPLSKPAMFTTSGASPTNWKRIHDNCWRRRKSSLVRTARNLRRS